MYVSKFALAKVQQIFVYRLFATRLKTSYCKKSYEIYPENRIKTDVYNL